MSWILFSGERLRRQAEGCYFSRDTMQFNKMFITVCQQRTSTVPKNCGTCGTKKYRKGDGTGTIEKWYRGAA